MNDDQLWSCLKCGTVRPWGTGEAADEKATPILRCTTCRTPQRFTFKDSARG